MGEGCSLNISYIYLVIYFINSYGRKDFERPDHETVRYDGFTDRSTFISNNFKLIIYNTGHHNHFYYEDMRDIRPYVNRMSL